VFTKKKKFNLTNICFSRALKYNKKSSESDFVKIKPNDIPLTRKMFVERITYKN